MEARLKMELFLVRLYFQVLLQLGNMFYRCQLIRYLTRFPTDNYIYYSLAVYIRPHSPLSQLSFPPPRGTLPTTNSKNLFPITPRTTSTPLSNTTQHHPVRHHHAPHHHTLQHLASQSQFREIY